MNWTEICITVSTDKLEAASSICGMVSAGGIYIEDYSDLELEAWNIAHIDLIDEALVSKSRSNSIIHVYVSEENSFAEAAQFIEERLKAEKIDYSINLNNVKDTDWADNWKKYFKVTPIGERLVICPSWESFNNSENKAVLKIDPGAAFGTGTHATTSLCLELLQEFICGGEAVLDIGCGSGILSIASVLLGSNNADGVDIDAASVRVAKENAEKNAVSEKTEFIVGDLADKISGKYDIVCANIVADIIMRLNGQVKAYMLPSAVYITSGIIDLRVDEVRESFKKCGFEIIRECQRDNWFAFALKAV